MTDTLTPTPPDAVILTSLHGSGIASGIDPAKQRRPRDHPGELGVFEPGSCQARAFQVGAGHAAGQLMNNPNRFRKPKIEPILNILYRRYLAFVRQ